MRWLRSVSALPQFVEQPRVLDSDDGLGGEFVNKAYLFVSKGTDFLAKQSEHTDQVIFLATLAQADRFLPRLVRPLMLFVDYVR